VRKHIVSYLGDFLFPAQRADAPVKMLSGGERNRLLLARLFSRSANVLVLDEPTNDLDIDSLELLEETLQVYPGTVLLVSHDRAFLDNVVTQTIAPEGGGRWREYVGGYSDWLAQRPVAAVQSAPSARREAEPPPPPPARSGGAGGTAGTAGTRVKLSYKESRELAELPARIEALEVEQRELNERMSRADYHRQGTAQIKADGLRLEAIERELATAFDRWAELEARSAALK
jgi:ATP-binding cassette subfamily F protein uup